MTCIHFRGWPLSLADPPRRREDLARRLGAAAVSGFGRRLYSHSLQSRIANTTIVVIVISFTVVAILCYRWWH
ncbi:MAG TPA: hypothetical protein VGF57_11430 [Roseiarcus sp.]